MKEENTFFPAAGPGDKGAGARPGRTVSGALDLIRCRLGCTG